MDRRGAVPVEHVTHRKSPKNRAREPVRPSSPSIKIVVAGITVEHIALAGFAAQSVVTPSAVAPTAAAHFVIAVTGVHDVVARLAVNLIVAILAVDSVVVVTAVSVSPKGHHLLCPVRQRQTALSQRERSLSLLADRTYERLLHWPSTAEPTVGRPDQWWR